MAGEILEGLARSRREGEQAARATVAAGREGGGGRRVVRVEAPARPRPVSPAPAAVLLAAGRSRRMGFPKGLVRWEGRPLVLWQAEALLQAGAAPVAVVLGYRAGDLLAALRPVLRGGRPVVPVVHRGYAAGRCSSLRAGLRALGAGRWAYLVQAVDQPVPGAVVAAFVGAARRRVAGERWLAVPTHGGRRGHPLLCGGGLLHELLGVREEERGVRGFLLRRAALVTEIAVATPRVHTNLNRRQDVVEGRKTLPVGRNWPPGAENVKGCCP